MENLRKIVIAEDSKTQAIKLKMILESEGFQVYHGENGKEALELTQQHLPEMVITDLMMPVMNGMELSAQIKADKRLQNIPVILVTYLTEVKDIVEGLQSKADNYISKPYTADYMLKRVSKILKEKNESCSIIDMSSFEVNLDGDTYILDSNAERIFNFLITAYETAIMKNQELETAKNQLHELNESLEYLVDQRTKELQLEIEERKKIELELEVARAKAEDSDKMKSIFLSNMSHDLRTPMNAIIGFTDLLKEEIPSQEEYDEFLDLISSNGESLLHLINDIIDLSKIEAGEVVIQNSSCSVNQIISELEKQYNKILKLRSRNKVEINTRLGLSREFVIETDPLRLKQILSNLITNAVKFTRQGQINFGYEIFDNALEFFVKDSGIGIKEKDLEHIFERFGQSKDGLEHNTGGTGLGLAISKNLVELMGGGIRVESEYGSGTGFYFTLPFKLIEGVSIEHFQKAPEFRTNYNLEGQLILIVEDDLSNYNYLKAVVKRSRGDVIWAKNGKLALEIYKQHPEIEIVLMDIHMPVMNGFETTKELKKINPNIVVIAQTAYAMVYDEQICYDAGCDDYLAKPIKPKLLLEKIENYLEVKKQKSYS
ncbi:MAG: response regulator [Bacteroidales bacterium]|nr:response regulator [Bacteroidales bacterium]